jgi:hypothetical protein
MTREIQSQKEMQVSPLQRPPRRTLPVEMTLLLMLVPGAAYAQQPVAHMPVSDAKVTGAVEIQGGEMRLASGSGVEAGDGGALITLTRGGELKVCANSAVHLATGAATEIGNGGELTLSLDRGAMELQGPLGKFSDVVITPDLRLLLSGPGVEYVQVRTNEHGDTCVDNAAPKSADQDAPYVTVTEQLGTGVYRVQAGQRVMFEHGSVSAVVDHEKEPCGCPPVAAQAVQGGLGAAPATPAAGNAPGKPEFPLAQSEGLAPPPPAPTEPVVKPGEPHAQVTIPFSYDGSNPAAAEAAAPPHAPVATPAPPAAAAPSNGGGDVWSAVKRLFGKIFRKQKAQPSS